jgi:hypothetical protein
MSLYASGTTIYKMSNTLCNFTLKNTSGEFKGYYFAKSYCRHQMKLNKATDNLLGLYSSDGKLVKQLTKDLILQQKK